LLDDQQREDADLRGAVLQALALDSLVPSTVDTDVADGWVTLTGTASWQSQRAEAQTVAGNIGSVVGVTDDIGLVPSERLAPDVEQSISNALQRRSARVGPR
jgi:osmotically-inducible protein OsmY